jgi:hypothetical protein
MFTFSRLVQLIAPNLPLLLVWLAGIVFAVVRWNRHPRVSALVVAGLSIFVISIFFGVLVSLMPAFIHSRGVPFALATNIVSALNLLLTLARILGWGLILAAVFANRNKV